MVKAVHLLCDLWAEFLIPSSVSEWKFNPTCLSHFTFFHFWENILKFSLDFSQLRFIACPWGRPCWFPLQIFSQSKSEISFSNKCSVFFQMKKGESWGWMILSSVGICSDHQQLFLASSTVQTLKSYPCMRWYCSVISNSTSQTEPLG